MSENTDLLESTDEEKEVTETKVKKPKKAKKKKAEGNGTTGRPVSDATLEIRKKILQLSKRKDGITNIDLATELEVTTAASQAYARPLQTEGLIKMYKSKENGRVTYKIND